MMAQPSLTYLICASPRTGSTLLSEALASTNIAGNPNEYFDIYDYNNPFWIRALRIHSKSEYVDRVVAASSTANGVLA